MNIRDKFKNIKERPFLTILVMFLLVEVLYLIKCNFVYGSMALDQDSAKTMTHMIEIVRNRKLLIPGWRYMTTHEIDTSILLGIPFYIITANEWVSVALSNIVYIFVLAAVVLWIFKSCNVKAEYALAALSVMFIPYGFGMLDYLNMMFVRVAPYAIKALIPLLAIIIVTAKQERSKSNITLMIIWLILVFLCGFSSGPLPLITAIIPLIGGYIINGLSVSEKKEIGSFSLFKTIFMGLGLVSALAGFIVHQVSKMNPGGLDAYVVYADDFSDRIHLNIYLFLYLINGLPARWSGGVPVVSLDGIGYVLRFTLGIIIVFCGVYYTVNFLRKHTDDNTSDTMKASINYLVTIILVNFVVHLLGSYNAPRYYIIEFICMIVLSGMFASKYVDSFKKIARYLLSTVIILCLFVIWYTSTKYINYCLVAQDNYGFCREICQIAEDNNVDNLITINATDVDEVCRILIPDINVSNYMPDKKQFISYDWYVGTYERSYYGERSLIATRDYDDVSSIFGESTGANYEYVGEVNGYKLFKSDVFCLPLDDENYVVKE